jgi:hypothetical protein
MAVDSLQKQPARVRGQPLQEGPVGQSGGGCQDLEHGDYRVVESSCLPIWQLFVSLKFCCKKQQQQLEGPRATVCDGAVRQCYLPT